MNQDFNQQQYNDKLAQVASLAVTYAKDGTGYHSMKDAFNELCEISHANKGIDQENTIGIIIYDGEDIYIRNCMAYHLAFCLKFIQ